MDGQRVQPAAGESQREFIARCIRHQRRQGDPRDQAAAICFAKWRRGRTENGDGEDDAKRTETVSNEPQPQRIEVPSFPEVITQQTVDRRYTELVQMALGDGRPSEVADIAVSALEQEFRDARPGETVPSEIINLRRSA